MGKKYDGICEVGTTILIGVGVGAVVITGGVQGCRAIYRQFSRQAKINYKRSFALKSLIVHADSGSTFRKCISDNTANQLINLGWNHDTKHVWKDRIEMCRGSHYLYTNYDKVTPSKDLYIEDVEK